MGMGGDGTREGAGAAIGPDTEPEISPAANSRERYSSILY